MSVQEYFLATRPWSFTATIIPILITTIVTKTSFYSFNFFGSLFMGLFIHTGANLTNTYYDYINKVDTKSHNHDSTLVDKKLPANNLLIVSFLSYTLGILTIIPYIQSAWASSLPQESFYPLLFIFGLGLFLAFFYTANPIGLKYRAMGDIAIFLCFGPLIMQCTSLILTHKLNKLLYLFSIPIGLLAEIILHLNNSRDIKSDSASGALTLANLLGFRGSYVYFLGLLCCIYLCSLYLAYYYYAGIILTWLSLPMAFSLSKQFQQNQMTNIVEFSAQLHLIYGLLMFIGIFFSSKGLETFL